MSGTTAKIALDLAAAQASMTNAQASMTAAQVRLTSAAAGLASLTPTSPPPPPPPLTNRTKVLSFLRSIAGTRTLVGQMTHDDWHEIALDKSAGIDPALIVIDYSMDGASWIITNGTAPLIAAWQGGALVGVSCIMPNPHTGGGAQDTNLSATELLTPGTATNLAFRANMDKIAAGLQQMKAQNVPVIHRMFMEMDGNWFWWGVENFTPTQYIQLFRMYHDYMVNTKGLDNLIWVYASNNGSMNQYPGDAYVDLIGVDAYTNDPAGVYGPIYNGMLGTAPTQMFALTEFGSGDPSVGNPGFNCQILVDALNNRMPKTVYALAWSGEANAGWDWSRYANTAALRSPRMIQRGQVTL